MIHSDRPSVLGLATLWVLFFLIAAGFGYPTLRRYDPRDPRTNFDGVTALYHWQVTGDASEGAFGPSAIHFRYRLLVPTVARPIFLLARGHVGTWDPGYFAFLVANAIFCGTTALLLFLVGCGSAAAPIALIAALLYLASFAVPNYLLAGLVDSGEAFALMALVWCLQTKRWPWLIALGAAGVLAKETFLPFAAAFTVGWVIRRAGEDRTESALAGLGWTAALAASGVIALTAVFSIANGHIVWPWTLEGSGSADRSGVVSRVARLGRDVGLLYVFGWLAPLGLVGLGRCPGPWIAGAFASAATAVALGIVNNEPGLARSLFNILGPLLSLASALAISDVLRDRSNQDASSPRHRLRRNS